MVNIWAKYRIQSEVQETCCNPYAHALKPQPHFSPELGNEKKRLEITGKEVKAKPDGESGRKSDSEGEK